MGFFDIIDKNCFNIWRYAKLYRKLIKSRFRLSLGEGWTKEENFSDFGRSLNLPSFSFKREDLNPLGSFKVRGLAYQISQAWQEGARQFCISSTGNAALSAAALCKKADLKLFIFFHQKPRSKTKRKKILQKIKLFQPQEIFFGREPTKKCQEFSERKKIYNLTPSSDKWSSDGFKSIGFEIFEKNLLSPNQNYDQNKLSIFSFSTSGSSMIGIGESFKFLLAQSFLKKVPRLYSVKQGQIKREKEVKKIVEESGGEILDISKGEIENAQNLLSNLKIQTSIEGVCSFGGFLKIQEAEKIKRAIIVLSGKRWIK